MALGKHPKKGLKGKMDFTSLLKFGRNGKPICHSSDFQWRQVGLGKGGGETAHTLDFRSFSKRIV